MTVGIGESLENPVTGSTATAVGNYEVLVRPLTDTVIIMALPHSEEAAQGLPAPQEVVEVARTQFDSVIAAKVQKCGGCATTCALKLGRYFSDRYQHDANGSVIGIHRLEWFTAECPEELDEVERTKKAQAQ